MRPRPLEGAWDMQKHSRGRRRRGDKKGAIRLEPRPNASATTEAEKKMKMASLVLGTAADQYGCFVPDLTRFLGTACEGTRQAR